jgi:hypothetical protein
MLSQSDRFRSETSRMSHAAVQLLVGLCQRLRPRDQSGPGRLTVGAGPDRQLAGRKEVVPEPTE